ncbi:MAG: hypothetical protein WC979_01655 [Candidatus Pacearchaeota archaeon]|jgi:hypothetical protein|nr:hypothetical protein [Clostridia bacterium]
MSTVYRHKYRRAFLDSDTQYDAKPSTSIDGLSYSPYDFQDPSIVGFRIRFDFLEKENLYDFDNLPNALLMDPKDRSSAYQYLMNINEQQRAAHLKSFIATLKSLQEDTPWYFQSISGLDSLQKIDPTKAWRPGPDGKITIETLESIDMRVSMLIDLYRKAAWDPIYSRWMLPENMRWFKVEIVIAEIRDFQLSIQGANSVPPPADTPQLGSNINGTALQQMAKQSAVVNSVNNMIKKGGDIINRVGNLIHPDGSSNISEDMILPSMQNTFLPMHVITLDMCEFDFLNRAHPYMSSISMADPGENISNSISFNVGRIREANDYRLSNIYLQDVSLRDLQQKAIDEIWPDGMKSVMMGTEDITKDITHNSSNTNFLKDRLKSVASTVAGEALDRFVESIFLGKSFNGENITKDANGRMETARQTLAKQIEFSIVNSNPGLSQDLGANESVANPGPDGHTNVPHDDMVIEPIINTSAVTPANVGLIVPDMPVYTNLGNIFD